MLRAGYTQIPIIWEGNPPPKPKLKSDVLGQFQTLNGSATYIRFGEEDIILKVEDSI